MAAMGLNLASTLRAVAIEHLFCLLTAFASAHLYSMGFKSGL